MSGLESSLERRTVFPSAVDLWFYVLVIGSTVVVVVAVLPLFFGTRGPELLLAIAILLLAVGLPVWLLFSTAYTVDGRALRIRSGPFTWTIPLKEIEGVRPSRSLLSSPALSLDRIQITYGRGRQILVSPEDREGFLEALGRREG